MLTLPIKSEWFHAILYHGKMEEYRDDTPYYDARFAKHEGNLVHVRFRAGYKPDSPLMETIVIPVRRAGAKPEWGGDPSKVYWVLEVQASWRLS